MGYTAEVEDEKVDIIPEDTIVRAQLLEIAPKEISWTDKQTHEPKSTTILEWKWEVVTGEFKGKWVRGSCDAKLSSHPGNRFRNWSESLLGRQLPVGTAFDTDDLIGLQADISIRHRADKKDPAKKYVEVDEVIPLGGGFDLEEPPF